MANKLQKGNLNDDINDIKHNYSTVENNENKMLKENLKYDIEQSKEIINLIKKENEVLKLKLNEKVKVGQKDELKKEITKVNKSKILLIIGEEIKIKIMIKINMKIKAILLLKKPYLKKKFIILRMKFRK